MKKLFTLALTLATAASAWGAVPELLFGPELTPVNPETTYQTGYTVEPLDLGIFVVNVYTQDSELWIRATSGKEVSIKVTADEPVTVCGLDNLCYQEAKVTDKTAVFAAATAPGETVTESLQIHKEIQDMTGAEPDALLKNIKMTVKAWYTDSPNEVAVANVILTNKPASEINGISAVVNDGSKVAFAYGNSIAYSVNKPTKLAIYNVSGNLVMSRTIYQTGNISLDSLHPGIYLFQAGNHKGKFLIGK